MAGSEKREFCVEHTGAGMIDVVTKRRRHERYPTVPSYGMTESRKREFCAEYARARLMNIKSKKSRHQSFS